jgi:hypothetical protein
MMYNTAHAKTNEETPQVSDQLYFILSPIITITTKVKPENRIAFLG